MSEASRERGLAERLATLEGRTAMHWLQDEERELVGRRERDKFEDDVQRRFEQANELRGALDDLGKQMATRRELETTTGTTRVEIDKAFGATKEILDAHATQLAELRSRLDVGPPQLAQLEQRAAEGQGARRGHVDSRYVLFAVIGFLLVIVQIISPHIN